MVRVLCPKCSERFRTHRELAQHCGSSHSDENVESPDFSVFSGSFSSMKDFEVWKTSLEKSTFAKFSKRDSKPRKNGRKHLYLCRHARGPKADIGAEVRHVHSKSKRIQSHCPAHLKVFERNDGTVVYEGCAGHLGHEINAASLRSRARASRTYRNGIGKLTCCKRRSSWCQSVDGDGYKTSGRYGSNAKLVNLAPSPGRKATTGTCMTAGIKLQWYVIW
ncbi:hypothetical protein COOONC_20669 [Cooperia oncophora]